MKTQINIHEWGNRIIPDLKNALFHCMLCGIIEKWDFEITLNVSDHLWAEQTIWSLHICDCFLYALWTCPKLKPLRVRVCLTALGKQVFLSSFHPRYALSYFHTPYKARLGKVGLVSCCFRCQKTILVSGQGKWLFPRSGSPHWHFGFNSSRPLITKRAVSQGAYQSKLHGMRLLTLL